jgi:hypothetical protein
MRKKNKKTKREKKSIAAIRLVPIYLSIYMRMPWIHAIDVPLEQAEMLVDFYGMIY